MLEHVEKYEIINKKMFGFLKRKSSNDTVISLTESVNSLVEENETVVSIFLDLAKAFNSISHKIFLEKIAKYGFSTESIAMLESFYLTENNCKERNWIFELGDNQSRSTSRNSSRTFNFYNVYQRFPRKKEKKRESNPMKICYAKLTMYLKILTVIWGKIC